MASSSKPTLVHFALIFFIMTSLVLGVMTFLKFKEVSENQADWAKKDQEWKSMKNALATANEAIDALKAKIGYPNVTDVGVGTEADGTVLGLINRDIRTYGGAVAQQTLAATIIKLREELDTWKQKHDAVDSQLKAEHQKLLALQDEYQNRVNARVREVQDLERDVNEVRTSSQESLDAKNQEIARLDATNRDLQRELDDERDLRSRIVAEKDERITRLSAIIDRLSEQLDEIRKVSFERADGEIRRVDHATHTVWINLGEKDRLPKGVTFSVYTKDHHGIGRGLEDIKAKIEVTRILGDHLAEARILEPDIYRPIAPGDPIYSPLWEPGRQESFSFVGIIDLDGDGHSDRAMLHELVQTAGARIDNEVDDEGNLIGEGITVHTKFLVIGEIPDPESTSGKQEEQEAAKKIMAHLKKLREDARLHAVRIVSLNDFLAYIGYKPQRRLYIPGLAERPFNLKAGARSAAVDETIGDRSSTGRVSGVYSRSRKLGQPVSTGRTSGRYGSSGAAAGK